jgi:2-octaprenyl-6-methoxyphenol hydroxylase
VPPDYDVLIAGAGAVGASLACALADSRLRVGIVEAVSREQPRQPSYDDRGLALALGTQQILERVGVWPALAATANPIRAIHITNRGHFGVVRLSADLIGAPALGYVAPARCLGEALLRRLEQAGNIVWHCPAGLVGVDQHAEGVTATLEQDGVTWQVRARILIAADGTHSRIRKLLDIATRVKDYGQVAVVSSVRPDLPHGDTAWERFTESGPFALLPLRNGRCVVVCCVSNRQADAVMNQSDPEFLAMLAERFGARLGSFSDAGPRHSYPIRLLEALEQIRGRILLMGNAVHTVHPNAAQGYQPGIAAMRRALARHVQSAGGSRRCRSSV